MESTTDDSILTVKATVLATVLLVVISAPIVVCMPLTSDTVLYDLQAKTVQTGGVLYRDILEPNLPGVVWIHLLVREIGDWSSEAMRIADLLIVGSAVAILAMLVRFTTTRVTSSAASKTSETLTIPNSQASMQLGAKPFSACGFFTLAAAVFYLSRNEWCHCQRDSWMLLPVAAAVWLRLIRSNRWPEFPSHTADGREHDGRGQALPAAKSGQASRRALAAICEGVLWGIAFWIKPHVAVTVIALTAFALATTSRRRAELQNTGWILLGGVLAGMPGIFWLMKSDAWLHFWDMQLTWNPEYLDAGQSRRSWHRVWLMIVRFHPWWLVHAIAVPAAALHLWRYATRSPSTCPSHAHGSMPAVSVLAVVYISWLSQSLVLQHAMDYIQVPPVILGLAFLAGCRWPTVTLPTVKMPTAKLPSLPNAKEPAFTVPSGGAADQPSGPSQCLCEGLAVAFLVFAVLVSPQLQPSRLRLWMTCLSEGTSRASMTILACGRFPDWQQLDEVEQFLMRQKIGPGDLTCYNVHCIHAYERLNVLPSTRYVGISALLELFPSRRQQILNTVETSGHRFLVADTAESNGPADQFPWNQPVVFQAGTFRVFDVAANTTTKTPAAAAGQQVAKLHVN